MATDRQRGDRTGERDRMARALAAERRRLVLAVLAEAGSAVSLADLARLVARREADRDGGRVDDRTEEVHVTLYHVGVPKLDEAGVVDWDRDRDVVRPGRTFQAALALADAIGGSRSVRSAGRTDPPDGRGVPSGGRDSSADPLDASGPGPTD